MGLIDCKTPSGNSTCEGCQKIAGVQQPRKLRVFKFDELVQATKSFSEKNILGRGSHSCVYKAVLSDGEVVAVKRPAHGRRTAEDAISFDNELGILSQLRHRHLVNLIGFCNEAHEKLLVVEFMENGTLYDVLHSNLEPIGWSARVHMVLQAAEAILALHSSTPPIIHRDVKSSNILIDRNWNAKLSDLGLALRDDVARQGTPPAGTMGYIDPAYETPSRLSSKSDVFSFGILLLEIMSGRKAIDVRYNPSSLLDWAVPLIRDGKALEVCDSSVKPPHNLEVVDNLAAIAARSVRPSIDRRPTMEDVVDGLQRIAKKLPSPRFGSKPLRVPRLAAPRVGSAEDSAPRIDIIPPTVVQKAEVVRKGSSDNIRKASSDNPRKGRSDNLRKESSDGVRRDSSDGVRRDSSDGGRTDSSDGVTRDSSDGVRISSSDGVRRDSSDGVRRDSSDGARRDSSHGVRRDSSEGERMGSSLSFAKWDELALNYDSSLQRNSSSLSDSEEASDGRLYQSRRHRRLVDGDGSDGRLSSTTRSPASPSTIRSRSSKYESPIFDPNSTLSIMGSPLRVDMIRNSAASPISPASSGSSGRSGLYSGGLLNSPRRGLESPTFGSKRIMGTLDASRTSVTGLSSPQHPEYSQLRGSKGSSPVQPHQSKRDLPLASQQSLREGSSNSIPLASQRNKDAEGSGETEQLPSSPKPQGQLAASQRPHIEGKEDSRGGEQLSSPPDPRAHLTSQRARLERRSISQELPGRDDRKMEGSHRPSKSFSKAPQLESGRAATRKSKSYREATAEAVVVSIFPAPVPFGPDLVVPLWDVPQPSVQFFTSTESPFEKVDCPIAV